MKLRTEVQREFNINKGDTHHPIEFRLVNMHNLLPIDISQAKAIFILLKEDVEVFRSDVNLEHGIAGIGRHDWKEGETDKQGIYSCYFELTCKDGNYFRIPEGDEFIKIEIE